MEEREAVLDDHNNTMVTDGIDELLNLVECTIIVKKEIYTLAQLREFYKQICGKHGPSLQSIDIKNKIKERFNEKVYFCKPSHSTSTNTTEYVIPAGTDIIPDAIHSITT